MALKATTLIILYLLTLSSVTFNEAWSSQNSRKLLIVNKSDNTASIVALDNFKSRVKVKLGYAPHEAAISPDRRFAYISNYGTDRAPGNSISVVNLNRGIEIGTIDLGRLKRPHGIVVSKDGSHIYVTCEGSGRVAIVDAKNRMVLNSIPTDQNTSHMIVLSPDEKHAYVANIGSGTITVMDLRNNEAVGNIKVGAGAEGIDLSPDGETIYVTSRSENKLSKIDTSTNKLLKQVKTDNFPIRVKVTQDGKRVIVSNAKSGSLQIFEASSLDEVFRFEVGGFPIGLVVEPDGQKAYLALSLENKVLEIDLKNLKITGEIRTGNEPDGMVFFRSGN
ncbi:MAG: beta-propeller fold lactonase family protein [Thermodesulfobacteriota bacterium]